MNRLTMYCSFTVISAILLAGCEREPEVTSTTKGYDFFSASIIEESSRVHLENGVDVKWNIGDQIAVFSDLQGPSVFTRDEDGLFRGELIRGNVFYSYPIYSSKWGKGFCLNETDSTVLDCDLTCCFYDTDEAPLPMVAISSNNQLSFKQTGGILHFRLKSENLLYYVDLTPISYQEAINGHFTINYKEDSPVLQLTKDKCHNMYANCPGVQMDSGQWDVYFHIPPMSFSEGFYLSIYFNDKETGEPRRINKITRKELTISRGEMLSFPLIDIDSEYDLESAELAREREVLLSLYQATDGDNWYKNTNWGSDMFLGGWYGVKTEIGGHVTELSLNCNHLCGELPKEVWSLPYLKTLKLNNNKLIVRIPTDESSLSSSLETIDLGNYDLVASANGDTQPILDKGNRILDGIPNSIQKLSRLSEFFAHKTQLSGPLPDGLWLPSLKRLWLQSNSVEGELSPSIGNAKNLEELELSDNLLKGCLPDELWLPALCELDLKWNSLEGELSQAIGNAKNLETLILSDNFLRGVIPEEICELEKLIMLDLSSSTFHFSFDSSEPPTLTTTCNQFTSLPSKMGKMKNLKSLILHGNALRGGIPQSLFECVNLVQLELGSTENYFGSYNDFDCILPETLGNLINLESLSLFATGIKGPLPSSFNNLKSLRFCDLTGTYSFEGVQNSISGSLPNLTGLEYLSGLYLDWNYIENNIPDHYADCPNLYLHAQYNCLSGVLPERIINADNFSNWSISPQRDGYGLTANLFYESTDYSRDGNVIPIQKASKGSGINIVIMGDAFADYEIADGTYDRVMRKGIEQFFSIEPFASFRDRFNVFEIETVSKNNIYLGRLQETALGTFFGEGTTISGDNLRCLDYAYRAIGWDDKDFLVIVLLNREYYAGTCAMYHYSAHDGLGVDYGNGFAIAYLPLGTDEDMFRGLILHEAGGHGFAKLADEYDSGCNFSMSFYNSVEGLNWYPNIDFTSDPKEIKWSEFLDDLRYADEGIGIYEGGATLPTGVWRPTEYSIMRFNTGEYNAPSRQAIWKRINKLSEGDEWVFRHEDFVDYDLQVRSNISTRIQQSKTSSTLLRQYPPLNPPMVFSVDKDFFREIQKYNIMNNKAKMKEDSRKETSEYSYTIGNTHYVVNGDCVKVCTTIVEPRRYTDFEQISEIF